MTPAFPGNNSRLKTQASLFLGHKLPSRSVVSPWNLCQTPPFLFREKRVASKMPGSRQIPMAFCSEIFCPHLVHRPPFSSVHLLESVPRVGRQIASTLRRWTPSERATHYLMEQQRCSLSTHSSSTGSFGSRFSGRLSTCSGFLSASHRALCRLSCSAR